MQPADLMEGIRSRSFLVTIDVGDGWRCIWGLSRQIAPNDGGDYKGISLNPPEDSGLQIIVISPDVWK